MYYEDHSPPHFHAYYGEYEASIEIDSARIITGGMPVRALSLVREWAAVHKDELRINWRRAENHQPLYQIDPLR